ncbi:MAG: ATP-binding protein [Candidatus Hydrothermarchaeales archaeon]
MSDEDIFKKPTTIEETKLGEEFIRKLVLKSVAKFEPIVMDLADMTGLNTSIIEPFLRKFEDDYWLTFEGDSPMWQRLRCVLTSKGREAAKEILAVDNYTGIAPVSYPMYKQVMSGITDERYPLHISKEDTEKTFEGVVGSEKAKKILTMAASVGRGVIVYGPPGNGKTFITSKMAMLLPPIILPRCIEYSGKVIEVYDEDFHQPLPADEQPEDPRWIKIYAPFVFTGAELSTKKLETTYNPERGAYIVPPQVKAHGGIFLVDDLGRQQEPHNVILNRLIVPMENKKDVIYIAGIPVEVFTDFLPVFSTNVSIAIFDEAHLRRAPFHIYMGPPTVTEFVELMKEQLERFGLAFDEDSLDPLKASYSPREEGGLGFQPCYATPRDLAQIIYGLSKYHEKEKVDSNLMEEAMAHYVVYALQREKVPLAQIGTSLTEEITTVELSVEGDIESINNVLKAHDGVKNFVSAQDRVIVDLSEGNTITDIVEKIETKTGAKINNLKVIGKTSQPIVDESKLEL